MRPSPPSPAPSSVESLTGPVLRARGRQPVVGLSRRALLRRSIFGGLTVWLAEVLGGTIGFLWSAVAVAPPRVRVGTLSDLVAADPGLPIAEGFPAYVTAAHAFVVLVDPSLAGFRPGVDSTGEGTLVNVRALSQVCPHLGCRPNPCLDDFWFHCPCHKSRYDRLGIKGKGDAFGPAQRGMDRFAVEVDADGVLTIDSARIVLGPLPVALGQPGLIPPKVANGCL